MLASLIMVSVLFSQLLGQYDSLMKEHEEVKVMVKMW